MANEPHNSISYPKTYSHQQIEEDIIRMWDEAKISEPRMEKNHDKEPFSILMPPPNANASLHAGHAMYVIQDILIRFHRMLGEPTVWFPGTDHAGFESQFVYENQLKKQGLSRFQFDRQTLFQRIEEFVKKIPD